MILIILTTHKIKFKKVRLPDIFYLPEKFLKVKKKYTLDKENF